MYSNIKRTGKDILRPNSKYSHALIREFEAALPLKKIPNRYLEFLLHYEVGEENSLNRYYYADENRVESFPVGVLLKGRKFKLTHFSDLPHVLKTIYHHDMMFGKKGFHRTYSLMKIAVSAHDFDGFYIGHGIENTDKIYYIETNSNKFQEENLLSKADLGTFIIAENIDEFVENMIFIHPKNIV